MRGLHRVAVLLLSGVLAAGTLMVTGGAANASGPPWMFWQNHSSGMCLDVRGVGTFDAVGQSTCIGIMGQVWQTQIIDGDNAFMLRSSASGLCMGLNDFSSFNGAPVVQLPCNSADQRVIWSDRVSHVGSAEPGRSLPLMFVSTVGKCLDVDGGQPIERLPMQLWDCSFDNGNQSWVGST
jgi:hypothetical protein